MARNKVSCCHFLIKHSNDLLGTYHPAEFQYTSVGLPSTAARGTSSELVIDSTFIVNAVAAITIRFASMPFICFCFDGRIGCSYYI